MNKALLGAEEAKAEEAFHAVCERYSPDAIGVWCDLPVQYGPLAPPPLPALSTGMLGELGWEKYGTPEQLAATLHGLGGKADDARRQQLGYAGWLTFHEDYRRERAELQQRWAKLDDPLPWPLTASSYDGPAQPVVQGEVARLDRLQRMWHDSWAPWRRSCASGGSRN